MKLSNKKMLVLSVAIAPIAAYFIVPEGSFATATGFFMILGAVRYVSEDL